MVEWIIEHGRYLVQHISLVSVGNVLLRAFLLMNIGPKPPRLRNLKDFRNLIDSTGRADGYETRRLRYPGFDEAPFPAWTHDLEETEMVLFWEIYSAVSLGLFSLAMMGVRTLVDRFANRTIGDIGGFEKKLEKMFSDGHINKT